jgi:MarR family transcriptional regulator for hemolysin
MDASLEQRFCLGLLRAARAWRRLADATATDFGLSDATAYPLVFIGLLGDGLRQSMLAEAIGIEGPSLVRLLDQLCAADLVVRREDPTDKRAKTLHLTAKGRVLTDELSARLEATRTSVLASADPEDLSAGLRVFGLLERVGTKALPVAETAA